MNNEYSWLKVSFFKEKSTLKSFYQDAILPYIEETIGRIEVHCIYLSLSTVQGEHINISILMTHDSKEEFENYIKNYFKSYITIKNDEITDNLYLDTGELELWKKFEPNYLYLNTYNLRLSVKFPAIFRKFDHYTLLNQLSSVIQHFINEADDLEFPSLMEANILVYFYLINRELIDIELLNEHIEHLELRFSLNTEDNYISLKNSIESNLKNNYEFLEECKLYSNEPDKFELKWLIEFSGLTNDLLDSSDNHLANRTLISELLLLFVGTLGMSPLKEIYSLHMINAYLSSSQSKVIDQVKFLNPSDSSYDK